MLGQWKNFEELEENLSLPELEAVITAARKVERQRQKFAAALKGVDIDNEEAQTSFEDVKRRAQAKARGISEEQLAFGEVGIAVIEE